GRGSYNGVRRPGDVVFVTDHDGARSLAGGCLSAPGEGAGETWKVTEDALARPHFFISLIPTPSPPRRRPRHSARGPGPARTAYRCPEPDPGPCKARRMLGPAPCQRGANYVQYKEEIGFRGGTDRE